MLALLAIENKFIKTACVMQHNTKLNNNYNTH